MLGGYLLGNSKGAKLKNKLINEANIELAIWISFL